MRRALSAQGGASAASVGKGSPAAPGEETSRELRPAPRAWPIGPALGLTPTPSRWLHPPTPIGGSESGTVVPYPGTSRSAERLKIIADTSLRRPCGR